MSCGGPLIYRYQSTNLLRIPVTDENGTPINDASAVVTLVDEDGVAVAGQDWPLAVPYVEDSAGIYEAAILDTLVVEPGETYVLNVTAVGDNDYVTRVAYDFYVEG